MKRVALFCLSMTTFLGVSGCSVFSIGESDFSCPGLPQGVLCKSTKEVYMMTNGEMKGAPVADPFAVNPDGSSASEYSGPFATKNISNERANVHNDNNANLLSGRNGTRPMLESANTVMPVLEPAKVIRVWVGPWTDSSGNLVYPTYVYSQVQQRTWSVKGAELGRAKVFTPVQVRSYDDANSGAAEAAQATSNQDAARALGRMGGMGAAASQGN